MGYKWVRNVAENWESMTEVKRDVETEIGMLKARNEELEAEVKVLRGRVRALEARNEAQVRRANDAWRQIRAILGYALRPVEA